MDGWGEGRHNASDAIWNANTPFIKSLYNNPQVGYSRLNACGEEVGLPQGQMGNSEVGHLNIGAGRVVYQDLVRINKAVEDHSIDENPVIKEAYSYAKTHNKQVHFLGLVSDGGVHSATQHLVRLCELTKQHGLAKVFVHVLTDGRDTDPFSGLGFVGGLMESIKDTPARIGSVCGRYYTMDRDKRWERVKKGYDLMTQGFGEAFASPLDAIQASYDNNITDEFIKPSVMVNEQGAPLTTVQTGDVFICFNFRTDRLREISIALTQRDMPEHGMKTLPLHYVTMARYDETFENVHVIFDKEDVTETLGEVISKAGKRQLRIAETEKYPHVTFFFSGGREEPFEGEERIMIPSPKVATYDLQPSMSALEVKEAVLAVLKRGEVDFICLNFANGDMVGHTGVYQAIIEAVETVDLCVAEITPVATEAGYTLLITADHGNADNALNDDYTPNTAHSLNQVPLFLLDKEYKQLSDGRLSDLAPTILHLMDIPVPAAMTGKILVK